MSDTAEEKLIEVNDLSFAYDVEKIINDANFRINRNDVITVVGPNGGGKNNAAETADGAAETTTGKGNGQG